MADSDQIKVVIRVRPLIERELKAGQGSQWTVKDDKLISQCDQPNIQPFAFDHVCDSDCATWELYRDAVSPIVEDAMNGYHATVFAYGQSGSGKTYTMSGNRLTPGIIALAMTHIFEFIEQKPTHEFLMRASYMEIYNEKIYDLLSKEDGQLKLQETPDHQINVVGLTEELVSSCDDVLNTIKMGDAKRTFAETKQNDRSSRSHCIFRIIIESREQNKPDSAVMVSHLNFVDLAGSEKAAENSGERLREGCSINKSLFSLSNVISKLSEGCSKQFIGYRDSKLTRILQNALGGNSRTLIVATISPTTIDESYSTLRFATRAKTIKNKPHVNEVLSDAAMLKKYRDEITRLKRLVTDMGVTDIQTATDGLKKQLEEKQSLIKKLTQQIVVASSLTDKTDMQKRKMRRETWCAPKLLRKSHVFSMAPLYRPQTALHNKTDMELPVTHEEGPDSSFSPTTSSVFDQSKDTRLTELGAIEDRNDFPLQKDLIEEVERLEEALTQAKEGHAEELKQLQERIRQLEFEKALDQDNLEERENSNTLQQEEVKSLKEQLEQLQYDLQLKLEENRCLDTKLWHAEKKVQQLEQEVHHLCNQRFDFCLDDMEQLERTKSSMDAQNKQLAFSLQQKDKEILELQKALAGQEPYIARLEHQLEMYMEADSGQLGTNKKHHNTICMPIEVMEDATSIENLPVPANNNNQSMLDSALQSEDSRFAVLQKTLVDLEADRDQLAKERSALEAQNADLSGRLQTSEKELQALQEELDKKEKAEVVQSALQSQFSSITVLPKTIASFEADRNHLAEEGSLFKTENAEVCGLLQSSEKELQALQEGFDNKENTEELQSALQSHDSRIAVLQKSLAGLEADRDELAKERSASKAQNADLSGRLQTSEKELQALQEEMDNRVKAEEGQSPMQSQDSRIAALEKTLVDLEAERDQLTEERSLLEAEKAELSDSLQVSEKGLQALQEELKRIKAEEPQPTLQSQDSRSAALEKTLVDLEAERDQIAKERSLLEAEKAELTDSLQTSEKGLQALQEELERKEKAEELQLAMQSQDSRIAALEKTLVDLEAERDQLAEERSLLEAEKAELFYSLQTSEKGLQALQEELERKEKAEELQPAMQSQDSRIAALEKTLVDIEAERDQLAEERSLLEAEKAELSDSLQISEKGLQVLQEELESTEKAEEQAETSSLETTSSQLQQAMQSRDSRIAALEKTLVDLEAERDQLAEERSLLEVEKAELTDSLQISEKGLQALQEELERKEKAEELQPAMQSQDSRIAALEKTLIDLEAERDQLAEERSLLEAEKAELSDSLQTSEKGLQALQEELERKEKAEELQPAMQSQDSRIAALKKTLVDLEAERDQLAEERSLLEAEKAELTDSVQISEKGLQALQEELESTEKADELQSAMQSQDSRIAALEKTLVNLEAERDQLAEERSLLEVEKAELSDSLQTSEKGLQALQEELERVKAEGLQSAIQSQDSRIAALEKTPVDLEAERDHLGKEWSLLEAEKAELTFSLQTSEKGLQALKEELDRKEKAELQSAMQNQDSKIAALEKTLVDLEAERDQLTEERSLLEAEKAELSDSLQVSEKGLQALQEELKRIKADELQPAMQSQDSRMAALEKTLVNLEAERDQLAEERSLLGAEKAELTYSLQTSEKGLQALQQELERNEKAEGLQSAMQSQDSRIAALEKTLVDLEAERDRLAEEQSLLEAEKAELSDSLQVSEKGLQALQEELEKNAEELQSAMQSQDSRIVALEKTIVDLEAERDRLTREQSLLEAEKAELSDSLQASEKGLQALQEELERKEKAEELQSAMQSQGSRIAALEKTLVDLEAERDQLAEERSLLEAEKAELSDSLQVSEKGLQALQEELEKNAEALQSAIQSQGSRIAALEKTLVDLEAERDQLAEERSLLEAEKAELTDSLQVSEKGLQALQEELEKNAEALQSAMHSRDSRIAALEKTLVDLEAERDQLAEERSLLEAEKAELSDSLQVSEKGLQALQEELEKNAEALQLALQHRDSRIAALERTLVDLEAERDQLAKERSLLEVEKAELFDRLQTSVRGFQALQEELDNKEKAKELQLALQSQDSKIAALQKTLAIVEADKDQLAKERSLLTAEKAELLERLQTAETKKQALREEMDNKEEKFVLKNRIRDITGKLRTAKEDCQDKKQYISVLEERLSKYENEEQEDKDEKIKQLEDSLHIKNMELADIKCQEEKKLSELKKELGNAVDMVSYKEQHISRLKREIRRIQSDDVSFCSKEVPKPTLCPDPVTPTVGDERLISSHSGVIDRYAVTLLQAENFKLKRELKKNKAILKNRNEEVHPAKVALPESKTLHSPALPLPPTSAPRAGEHSVDGEKDSLVHPLSSSVDKENSALGCDILSTGKTSFSAKSETRDSPVKSEHEFVKPRRPLPLLQRPSSTKLFANTASEAADQCKTQ